MDEQRLRAKVSEAAEELDVPGVAVGIVHQGVEHYAFHGVTSIENPLPVDAETLFQFGSTGKTFTATAIMRLVEAGKLDLDAPVRQYLPDLRLKDEDVAAKVTLLHLLNHTAGWQGDLLESTGDGDDALARYVDKMAELEQEAPLGSVVSYNNASLSLAGRVIEVVTGQTFEQAIKELLFEPLDLQHSFFFPNDVMTRRFAVGHTQHPDGRITVARPWALPRGGSPAGGISANAGDQIRWARFHLGDGEQILSTQLLKLMQQPTVEMRGSALGDYVGISWLLRDIDGVRVVGHGGSTNGQYSSFDMVPERDFAVVVMTNCGPNGAKLHDDLSRWALEAYLGVVDRDPEPAPRSSADLAAYVGHYETIAATVDVAEDHGGLAVKVTIKPHVLAQIREADEDTPEDQPPIRIGLLDGDGDRYVVTEGPAKGMKGYFVRNPNGRVEAVHMGGRLAVRK